MTDASASSALRRRVVSRPALTCATTGEKPEPGAHARRSRLTAPARPSSYANSCRLSMMSAVGPGAEEDAATTSATRDNGDGPASPPDPQASVNASTTVTRLPYFSKPGAALSLCGERGGQAPPFSPALARHPSPSPAIPCPLPSGSQLRCCQGVHPRAVRQGGGGTHSSSLSTQRPTQRTREARRTVTGTANDRPSSSWMTVQRGEGKAGAGGSRLRATTRQRAIPLFTRSNRRLVNGGSRGPGSPARPRRHCSIQGQARAG